MRLRADRIGALRDDLLPRRRDRPGRGARATSTRSSPTLLVVDSVQTVASAEVDGSPGNVSQVREVAAALIRVAKERGIATVLVGHVTKDGSIAGPRLLEHLVDVVLHFEGDRHSRLRMVRGVKNRYGPADEVGCFDLSDDGIDGLADPSGLFLSQQREAGAGHLRHGHASRASGRWWPRCRRWSAPSTLSHPAAYDQRARRRPAWRWCWPCCSGAAQVKVGTLRRLRRRPSAACG